MRSVLALVLLGLSGLCTIAQAELSKLERVFLYDQEYVRVRDWAEANGFQMLWPANSRYIQLSCSGARVRLTIDSRRAEINGISVWLSMPVTKRRASALIGVLDLQTALHPILFPAKGPKGRRIGKVCLDPGHGGRDPGNQSGAQHEKQYTLLLARELRTLLLKQNLKVVLTRSKDQFVELPNRPEIAARSRSDLFISLHFNATAPEAQGARGVEVYCLTPAGAASTNTRSEGGTSRSFPGNKQDSRNILLAYQVQKSLVKGLGMEDRGVRRARFAVLHSAGMPAILIEAGYISDAADARRINDPVLRRKLAQAIANGILAYKHVVER